MKELDMYINYLINQERSDLTIQSYKRNLIKWFQFQKINSLDDLKKVEIYDIDNYDTYLTSQKLSINTRFTYTIPICGFYTYLLSREIVSKNPYKLHYKLKNKNESEAFTLEEIKRFLSHCKKPRDKALFSLMFETGMRYREVVNIKLSDIIVDNISYYITVIGKGNKKRSLGFSNTTYNLIKDYVDNYRNNKDSDLLFITKNGKTIDNKSLNYTFKRISNLANIDTDRKHIHMTRHSFCTAHINNNENVKSVQEMMGHSSAETTLKIYSHIKSKELVNQMSNNSLIYP